MMLKRLALIFTVAALFFVVSCDSGDDETTETESTESTESTSTTQPSEETETPTDPIPEPEGTGASMDDGGGMENVLTPDQYDESEIVTQPGAIVGNITTCPVSGEVFRVSETSPHATHNGQEVYFCCAGCIGAFEANPENFLTPAAP